MKAFAGDCPRLRWRNPSVIAGASSRDNLINLPNFVRYATAAGESEIFPADELLGSHIFAFAYVVRDLTNTSPIAIYRI